MSPVFDYGGDDITSIQVAKFTMPLQNKTTYFVIEMKAASSSSQMFLQARSVAFISFQESIVVITSFLFCVSPGRRIALRECTNAIPSGMCRSASQFVPRGRWVCSGCGSDNDLRGSVVITGLFVGD